MNKDTIIASFQSHEKVDKDALLDIYDQSSNVEELLTVVMLLIDEAHRSGNLDAFVLDIERTVQDVTTRDHNFPWDELFEAGAALKTEANAETLFNYISLFEPNELAEVMARIL